MFGNSQGYTEFAIHLGGRSFSVVTDHRALQALQSSSRLSGRLLRWALALQQYLFTVEHRSGSQHQNADAILSHQAWPKEQTQTVMASPEAGGVSGSAPDRTQVLQATAGMAKQ